MPPIRHLLLATVEDAFDQTSWSGIPWSLRVALEKQVERLTVFRPGKPSRHPWHVARRILHGGQPPRYPLHMSPATLRSNARGLQREIARAKPDAVLSISSECIAELPQCDAPVVMFSDAPWMAWHNAYEGTISRPIGWQRFAATEARTANRIQGLCFGSEWAIEQARTLYETAQPLTTPRFVTPLGANWVPELSTAQVLESAAARTHGRVELLFVGKDWERKGGPLAVETAMLLHSETRPVTLHIVGCRPTLPPGAEHICQVHGPLYQTDREQSMRLASLFLRSHFLLVPTTAECYGIIFAEAQAFALPPVSRAVHALPTVIQDGVTGALLPPDAPAQAYADAISALAADPARYQSMCEAARARYERLLNWDACARGILTAMSSVTSAGR